VTFDQPYFWFCSGFAARPLVADAEDAGSIERMPGAEVCGVRRPGHRSGGSLGFHAHAETGRHSAVGYIRKYAARVTAARRGLLRDLVRKNSGASLRLITFAGRPIFVLSPASGQGEHSRRSRPEGRHVHGYRRCDATGPEHIPGAGSAADLLISDGNENRGHALTAALRAREQGIAVFTVLRAALRRCP